MQFENGALKIINNICSLCNDEFSDFVHHLVTRNHINHQFLTKEFCSSLSLNDNLISTQTLPLSIPSLQTLIFYLKSHKLPLYFKQLYSCHKCLLIYDSIHLLFSHLNKCDSIKLENENEIEIEQITESIPDSNHSIELQSHSSELDTSFSREEDGEEGEDDEVAVVEEILEHDSEIEIVAEIIQSPKQTHCAQAEPPRPVLVSVQSEVVKIQEAVKNTSDQCTKRFHTVDSRETIILRSASLPPRSMSPSKDLYTNGTTKNGHSSKQNLALESRSNKRLLRSLSKNKPEPKSVLNTKQRKTKSKVENDTFVLSAVNKKKFSKICASLFKSLKCKFCNRGSFKHEQNLQAHYQNVHNFFPMKQQSELLLTRFTSNETKKCFQFRCLLCLKMFENFTALSQHRCKYYSRPIHIPKKQPGSKGSNDKAVAGSVSFETPPDYESETEFFKNLGLVRRSNSAFKCEHVKPKLQNISNKFLASISSTNKSPNENVTVQVKSPGGCSFNGRSNSHKNGFSDKPTNRFADMKHRHQQQKRKRSRMPDDVIISLVAKPTTSRRCIKP